MRAKESEEETPEGWEAPLDPIRDEPRKDQVLHHLRCELAKEQWDVTMEYKLYKLLYLDFPWYVRDSLCAPQDKNSGAAIRQEQFLAQDIERTLRLIEMLKARRGRWVKPSGARPGPNAVRNYRGIPKAR